jgi:hypothetical protein
MRQIVPSTGRNIPNANQTLRSAPRKLRGEAVVDGVVAQRAPGTNLALGMQADRTNGV